jgi:ABC-type branched-subunit amino acid transport system substrate-binding protein
MPRTFSIGLLLSTDGTYCRMGTHAFAGARDALAEINEDGQHDFHLHASHVNPRGHLGRYGEGAAALMGAGIRHLFGTITSASRKEIIPDLEQHGGLLWYACPYEGFESSENVLYLGGCPNQTLIPLLRYALRTFGRRAQLIGSNYVWGWESNRIAREALQAADGEVLAEKYFHLGTSAFADCIKTMMAEPPAFILNNLVGESSYAFLAQLDQACATRGFKLPVLSCNLTEAELGELGSLDNLQLLSCGPFFEAVNPQFSARQQQRHGLQRCSHYYTGTYAAVHLLAQALQHTSDDHPEAITEYLHQGAIPSALGALRIAPHNNHTSLPCHIAELRDGRFCLLHSEDDVLAPDPYLTATDLKDLRSHATAPLPLRIVK